ncbi:hypothetical protein BpHYR1_033553 [Brachionus plicatilis]|uniref:Uncharacterized protein n=1 Tax=Brachionus plicatilis TaxID=10195 RepID=A0A3M7T348_BRAPC|nr:hypothetical protein BpHYR1_033553 [Brachionus plicatilis]
MNTYQNWLNRLGESYFSKFITRIKNIPLNQFCLFKVIIELQLITLNLFTVFASTTDKENII